MPADVTAVITTHSRPETVREALASVFAETHASIECVVVDDGGSFELPAHRVGADVRVVRGGNLGVARARNLGLAAARGEFVIFLDDDDVALPHRISTLRDTARRFGADLCYGLTRRSIVKSARVLSHVPTGLPGAGDVGFCDVLACAPHINSVLVRTAALRNIGGFDVAAHHFDDWSVWLRLADRGVVMRHVGEVVAEWRIHKQGLSGEVLRAQAMKSRLRALFDLLEGQLSEENAGAVSLARRIVASSDIRTYDDYARAVTAARARLHASGSCLGKRLDAHASPRAA